jgi:hypothetical protein
MWHPQATISLSIFARKVVAEGMLHTRGSTPSVPHRQVQEAQIAVSCALHVIGFLLSAANWTKLWLRCFTQKRTKLEWNSALPKIRTLQYHKRP